MQAATPFRPRSQTVGLRRVASGAWLRPAIYLACCALSVWLSVSFFVGAGYDDIWLPLWSGERLAETGRLINHNGEPAEIASSLLHVLLIAGFHALAPGSALLMSKLTGLLSGVLVLTAIYAERDVIFRALPARLRTAALAVALFATATHPSWLNWNLGGLETPYQSLILTVHTLWLLRHISGFGDARRMAISGALYAFVRPEGVLLLAPTTVVIVGHAAFVRTGRGATALKRAVLPPLAFTALLTLARLALFGMLAPAPAHAKIGAPGDYAARLADGLAYLADFFRSSPWMLIVASALVITALFAVETAVRAALRRAHAQERAIAGALAIGLIIVAHTHGLAAFARGDWMTYFRFLAPAVPVLSIVVALALTHLAARVAGQSRAAPIIGAACALLLCAGNIWQNPRQRASAAPPSSLQQSVDALFDKHNGATMLDRTLRLNASYVRDSQSALPFVRDALPRLYHARGNGRLTIVAYQMGYLPYMTKHMHPGLNVQFIDTMGLTDPAIARLGLPGYLWGVRGGERLDQIVAGGAGTLSAAVLTRDPDLLYFVELNDAQRAVLAAHGWQPVWQKPGAVFYAKEPSRLQH